THGTATQPRTPNYFLISATAVATLCIASVARMMMLAAAASSSVTSNSSRRESAIPSTGYATRQRLASSEYSTRWTADWSSRTTNFTVARAPVRTADCTSTTGGVLSMSKLTLSNSPTRAVAGELDGASVAVTFT